MDADDLVAARQAETLEPHPDLPTRGHCKGGPPHLAVLVVDALSAHGVGDTTVRYIEKMSCVNDRGYHGWGALLHHPGKQEGLHLLPEGVAYLVSALPVAAGETGPGEGVALAHTFAQALRIWRVWTADEAFAIAEALAALPPK